MHKSKIYKIIFFIISSLLFLTACKELNLLNDEDIPKWTITINEVVKYPRASLGEKEVESFDGRPIWIRKHYEFTSKSIESIEAIPIEGKDGYYKLKLNLDKHGSMVAMRLCNDPTHDPWGLLINGVYYRSITFDNCALNNDYTEIELKGPFDKTVAENLEEYSTKNYEFYHQDD